MQFPAIDEQEGPCLPKRDGRCTELTQKERNPQRLRLME